MLNLQEQNTLTTLENVLQEFIEQGCNKMERNCYDCNRSIHTDRGYYCGANRMMDILDDIKRNIEEEDNNTIT